MALLTVKGRKTGKQPTTPVAILKMNENRYIVSVYGSSSWVRNLRTTSQAKLLTAAIENRYQSSNSPRNSPLQS